MTHQSSFMAHTLPVSYEETQYLEKVLQSALEELRVEVRHTDTREYRARLNREREVLQAVFDRLQALDREDLKKAT